MTGNQAVWSPLAVGNCSDCSVIAAKFNANLEYLRYNFKYSMYMPLAERLYHKDAAVITSYVTWSVMAIVNLGDEIQLSGGTIPKMSAKMKGRIHDVLVINRANPPWWL